MKEYKLKIKTKKIKEGMYEVEGVIFYANGKVEAIRKWARSNKPSEVEKHES